MTKTDWLQLKVDERTEFIISTLNSIASTEGQDKKDLEKTLFEIFTWEQQYAE